MMVEKKQICTSEECEEESESSDSDTGNVPRITNLIDFLYLDADWDINMKGRGVLQEMRKKRRNYILLM